MSSRINRIEIQNFKAFSEFSIDVEGRHLLVYGANGSGKSSLYWSLYTFLQSARKPQYSIAKYFTSGDKENLLNLHEDVATRPGQITLTLRDEETKIDTTYNISETIHGTYQEPIILNADLASDFIDYRFFFGFSHFRNSERFDLWPLFEKEILPFCVPKNSRIPIECWNEIKSGKPNPSGSGGVAGTYAYDEFHIKTNEFAVILERIINDISSEAQEFYNKHFSHKDPLPVTLKLGVTELPSAVGSNKDDFEFTRPFVEFGIQINGQAISRPQSFLNEAKMTQIALSIRFAASLVNLNQSDLKLLVLDDLLVSLDMSNRKKVVEILLSETFVDYQKVILTHDLGFFQEFRRKVASNHTDWCFLHLQGTSSTTITPVPVKTDLEKVEEYIAGHNLDEAALCLRKVTEATVDRFLNRDTDVLGTRKFVALRSRLQQVRDKVLKELPVELYEEVLRGTPVGVLCHMLPIDDTDLDAVVGLGSQNKEILKLQRSRLRQLMTCDHTKQLERVKLLDDVLACTARVLNPSAHHGNPPLYKQELADAQDLIRKLGDIL